MVAIESVKRMRLSFGMRPSSPISPARRVTPTRVPILSNRSTNRNTNRISNSPIPYAARKDPGEVELEGGLRDRGQVVGLRRERDEAERPAGERRGEDADQDRAAHLPRRQRGGHDQPEQSERGAGRVQVAERHRGRRAGDDDPGILEADEGDEQADPARHRREQMRRDRGDDELADAGEGQHQEGDARDEDAAQRHRPRHAHPLDDGEAEIGVEPHARRQRERHVGGDAHQDAGEARGEAGGRRDRRDRHAGLAQDRRIDQHDIGHGQEGGDAREDLGAQGAAARAELEAPFEQANGSSVSASVNRRAPFSLPSIARGDGSGSLSHSVIASEAKQSRAASDAHWIASSLRSSQ